MCYMKLDHEEQKPKTSTQALSQDIMTGDRINALLKGSIWALAVSIGHAARDVQDNHVVGGQLAESGIQMTESEVFSTLDSCAILSTWSIPSCSRPCETAPKNPTRQTCQFPQNLLTIAEDTKLALVGSTIVNRNTLEI